MNVYVETNFIFELAFQQEQFTSCEAILDMCSAGHIQLIIPAYSFAEPHEKLFRQEKERKELHNKLIAQLTQLSRTSSYAKVKNAMQDVDILLIQSIEEQKQRFNMFRELLLSIATIIPLYQSTIIYGINYEKIYGLSPQDAIIYASIVEHLQKHHSVIGCFINANTKDFDIPDIKNELAQYNCRMIPKFDDGYQFAYSQMIKKQG